MQRRFAACCWCHTLRPRGLTIPFPQKVLGDKHSSSLSDSGSKVKDGLRLEKVLVLSKMSRYEFEKNRFNCNAEDLQRLLAQRGSDYNRLRERHDCHYAHLEHLLQVLRERHMDVRLVKRLGYSMEAIRWADLVITVGGDGTFLLGASKIPGRSTPIIGFNSDPSGSEGVLCLDKKYSEDFGSAVDKLETGKFRWKYLQRIRTQLTVGEDEEVKPKDLENQQLLYPEHRFLEDVRELETYFRSTEERSRLVTVPFLALNDVFIGETLSARPSYYELKVDDEPMTKQKSSGLTVCTGTGSTSWHFNINRLTRHTFDHILQLVADEGLLKDTHVTDEIKEKLVHDFNKSIAFDPTSPHMAYSVRDPMLNVTSSDRRCRGFAGTITVRSRGWDACINIDGSISYHFNDGAIAVLTVDDADALRGVELMQ